MNLGPPDYESFPDLFHEITNNVKVNTECQIAFTEATRKYFEENRDRESKGFTPRAVLAPGLEATKAMCIKKMELFGSIGKA